MVRFKKIPIRENEGKIIYGNGIVDGIVLLAIAEIPNVELYTYASRKKMSSSSINVTIDKDGVHIDITVKVHYTQSISDVAFKIQEAVRHNVETMTEYHIASVNVIVKGVMFNELKPIQNETIINDNAGELTLNTNDIK